MIPAAESVRSSHVNWVTLVLVLLFVFGGRCLLIREHGSPLPYWDEWDAEGQQLLPAYTKGQLHIADLFAPHNEHRILFTRLQSIALLELTGAWEPRVQMVVNAAWMALAAALLAGLVMRHVNAPTGMALSMLVAVLFAAPHDWQNTLWGFQSHNAFQMIAGVIVIGIATRTKVSPGMVAAGLLAGCAGLFTSGAGLLAPLAIAMLALAGGLCGRPTRRRDLIVAMLGIAVVAIGWSLRVSVPGHAWLQAKSVGVFLGVFLHSLAWPGIALLPLCFVLWTPVALLTWQVIRGRRLRTPAVDLALTLGLWTILHAASIAWARGQGMAEQLPLSRYLDGLMPGVIGNALALVVLATGTTSRRSLRLGAIGWSIALGLGLAHQTYNNLAVQLPLKDASSRSQLALVGAYVETGDATALEGRTLLEIGHADPTSIRRVLDDEANESWRGKSLRQPTRVAFQRAESVSVTLPQTGYWEIELTELKAETSAEVILMRSGPEGETEHVLHVDQFGWGRRAWARLAKGDYTCTIRSAVDVDETAGLAFWTTSRSRVVVELVLEASRLLVVAVLGIALGCLLWRISAGSSA